jgi:hypothetical protein
MRQGNTPLFCLKMLEDDYSFNLKRRRRHVWIQKMLETVHLADDSDCSLEHFYYTAYYSTDSIVY